MLFSRTMLAKQEPIQKKQAKGGQTRPSGTVLQLHASEHEYIKNNSNDFQSRPSYSVNTPIQTKPSTTSKTLIQRASLPNSKSALQQLPSISFDNLKVATQLKQTVPVNDDENLEKEADIMGGKAVQMVSATKGSKISDSTSSSLNNRIAPIQGFFGFGKKKDKKLDKGDTSSKTTGSGIIGWFKSLFWCDQSQ